MPHTDPIARAVCQGDGRASINFPLLMYVLQLAEQGRGWWWWLPPPTIWGFSPPLLPCKKKTTNTGSFLNQPSGVPQREDERDTEREREKTDKVIDTERVKTGQR